MSFGVDNGPATLAFVTRVVTGSLPNETTRFDPKLGENVRTLKALKNTVIVFFPNGTTQVLPADVAEQKGFLERPSIMNFEAVVDASSIVGKFKFAMDDAARRKYWEAMEQTVISACVSKSGHPLPLDVNYSNKSLFFTEQPNEGKAA